MPELATIRIFERANRRGRRYWAQLDTAASPPSVVGKSDDDLIQAVLNVLADYDKAERFEPGVSRGRPPAARVLPGRLGRRRAT